MEHADFSVTQSPVEQLKFIQRPAQIPDQGRGGIRAAFCIPVAQLGRAEPKRRAEFQLLAGNGGAIRR
jgi:hypothetical protein